jgi:hypothetical protein
MKKTLLLFGFILISFLSFSQTQITVGMTGAQVRNAINGNFNLTYPLVLNTTSSNIGVLKKNNVRFIHNYPGRYSAVYDGSGGDSAIVGKNLFIGLASGNFTMNPLKGCNVGIGDSTLNSLTVGVVNTAVGFNALRSNTSGWANTAVGRQSQWKVTIGTGNTSVGESSLERNVTGVNNVMVGVNAGQYAGGSRNVGVGFNALFSYAGIETPSSGSDNTGIGDDAGAAMTSGNHNTLVGSTAGGSITTADNNTMIGALSGLRAGAAHDNTYLGYYTGYLDTTGYNNIAIGTFAYGAGSRSKGSIAIGSSALYQIYDVYYNIAIGQSAGYNLKSGTNNIFLGHSSGYYQTGSNILMIDNYPATRSSLADEQASAIIVGKMDSNPNSQIVTLNAVLKLKPLVDPSGITPSEGMIYADTDHHLYYYNGTTWVQIDN